MCGHRHRRGSSDDKTRDGFERSARGLVRMMEPSEAKTHTVEPMESNLVLQHARSELQKLGIDKSIPDDILKHFVREVKVSNTIEQTDPSQHTSSVVQNPPSPSRVFDEEDTFVTTAVPVGSSFDGARGLFRPPQTPPRDQTTFQYMPYSPHSMLPRSHEENFVGLDEHVVEEESEDEEDEATVTLSLLSPRPSTAEAPPVLSTPAVAPAQNGIVSSSGGQRGSTLGSPDLTSSQQVSVARTPSSMYGPYCFNSVDAKKVKKVAKPLSDNVRLSAAPKSKKRLKGGAKRIVRKNSASSGKGRPAGVIPGEDQQKRFVAAQNRRLLDVVHKREAGYQISDIHFSQQEESMVPSPSHTNFDGESVVWNENDVADFAGKYMSTRTIATVGGLGSENPYPKTPVAVRATTRRLSNTDHMTATQQNQGIKAEKATRRNCQIRKSISRPPYSPAVSSARSRAPDGGFLTPNKTGQFRLHTSYSAPTPRQRRSAWGVPKIKRSDPVKMFAKHQKNWKRTPTPSTKKMGADGKHDRVRLEIRAKMLRTRILNEHAGKRGMGKPTRSVDKWL